MADIKVVADYSDLKDLRSELSAVTGSAKASAKVFERELSKALEANAKSAQKYYDSLYEIDKASKSAYKSAQAMGAELDKQDRRVEQLAQKYKPLYAASKQYEKALNDISDAHRYGVLSAKQQVEAVDRLNKEYQDFNNGVAGWTNQFVTGSQAAARSTNHLGMGIQQVGYQVGDFLVQWQSGTNVLVAFGQQATQLVGILPAFATQLGLTQMAAIGLSTALGIGIPLVTAIGAAFMRSSGAGKTFEDQLGQLESSVSGLKDVTFSYTNETLVDLQEKYGEVNLQLKEMLDTQRALEQATALNAMRDAAKELKDEINGFYNSIPAVADRLDITRESAVKVVNALDLMGRASSFEEGIKYAEMLRQRLDAAGVPVRDLINGTGTLTRKQVELLTKVVDTEDQLRQLSAAQPDGTFLSSAINQANNLWEALKNAVSEKNKLSDGSAKKPTDLMSDKEYQDYLNRQAYYESLANQETVSDLSKVPTTTKSGSSGGGGSAMAMNTDKLNSLLSQYAPQQSDLDKLNEWRQKAQEALNEANNQELLSLSEHSSKKLQIEQTYQDQLAQIKQQERNSTLSTYANFFGSMASLMENGNKKQFEASKKFALAQSLTNSYLAFTEVLRDPSFVGRPWERAAAAGSILASGLAQVKNIQSTSYGSSGSSSASSATSASATASTSGTTASAPQRVQIQTLGTGDFINKSALSDLFDMFYEENEDRGVIFSLA